MGRASKKNDRAISVKENSNRKAAEYKNFPLMILTNEHEFVFRILPLVENPFLFFHERWLINTLITNRIDHER
jgi:hypothetical protein